jgi:FMN phosphatase YigB (HAD superfamily)
VVVSFDLFGTLVAVSRPSDPAPSVAAALEDRGVAVPADWDDAYREPHVDAPDGAEIPLPVHVRAALRSRGCDPSLSVVRRAVRAAFDPSVETREGARAAVSAAWARGPVGLLSNCSVPGLVARALDRSALDRSAFDAVVSSVDCGWRKPDERAFVAVADALGVRSADLWHVGDDPATDGGVEAVGGRFVDVSTTSLRSVPAWLASDEEGPGCR